MVSMNGRKQGKNSKNIKANLVRLEKRKRCASYLKELLLKKERQDKLRNIELELENNYERSHYFPCSAWQDYLNCFYEEGECGEKIDKKFEKGMSNEGFSSPLNLMNFENNFSKKLYNQYKLLELDQVSAKKVKKEDLSFVEISKANFPNPASVKEKEGIKKEVSDDDDNVDYDFDYNDDDSNCETTNLKLTEELEIKEEEEEDDYDPITEADTAFNFKHSKRKKFEYRPYLEPFEIKIILPEDTLGNKNIHKTKQKNHSWTNNKGTTETYQINNFQKHRRRKNLGNRQFECTMCGNRFKTKGHLKAHEELTHSDVRNFECEECNFKFKTKYHLKTHCMKVHNKNESIVSKQIQTGNQKRYPKRACTSQKEDKSHLTCNLCQLVLNNRRLLSMHMIVAHTKKSNKIGNFNHTKSSKTRSQKDAERKAYNLRKITENEKKSDEIIARLASPTEEIKIFECDHCGAFYSNKCLLKNHILDVHLFYHCSYPDCGLVFKKKPNLLRHKNVHTMSKDKKPKIVRKPCRKKVISVVINKRDFECDHCKTKFTAKSFLSEHILKFHDEDKPNSINSGSSIKLRKRTPGRPINADLDGRQYPCVKCPAAFKTRSHLQAHCQQRHSEERNFLCSVCHAQFKTKGILKTHSLRMHKTFQS